VRKNHAIVLLVFAIFFVISLLTNILGPIVPDVIRSFHVGLGATAFLPFCFFIAYGVMSIPAGFLIERFSEKPVMTVAFVAATAGALSFALVPVYSMAVFSLFTIGAGMAALQVAINPLLRVAGGEAQFAFNSAFAQLVFGSASFLSPRIYSYLVEQLGPGGPASTGGGNAVVRLLARLTPASLPWVSIYWVFTVFAALMVFIMLPVRLPKVELKEDERPGTLDMYRSLLHNRVVWLYFLCIFAYVGSEQGTADWMSEFLSHYHGFDPHTVGANAVSWFWGLLTAGCFIGMILLKFFDSRRVLLGFSIGALGCLGAALFGPATVSFYAFPLIGLFASIMWPTVVSLALNSIAEHHGSFAGILCTGIMGGAIVPLVIGKLGDLFGLRAGMMLLFVTFGVVLSASLWARPLVNNATLGAHAKETEAQ
jgi:fucose permease